ncbi:MAG: cytochrome [Actinomycetia bacterium]|nr:cytochrome [Actinomycetes bacterium]
MAAATFPDGTLPGPVEVAGIASNMFAAGQETTVRLIGAALRRIADEPELQARLRANRELIRRFVGRPRGSRARSRASSGCA